MSKPNSALTRAFTGKVSSPQSISSSSVRDPSRDELNHMNRALCRSANRHWPSNRNRVTSPPPKVFSQSTLVPCPDSPSRLTSVSLSTM